VQYSRNDNPLMFTGGDSGSFKISSDKVIYGSPIRGGTNSPSLLFWTLSSVVRVINTGVEAPDFQIDVISQSTSIMATRCVVEYDGLFFWPGVDRFFVYNGVVQEMSNNINIDYFFKNIDLNYRQQVFGLIQPQYGEIWWLYPEKLGTPGRNVAIPEGQNTRAIIYNKKENSWYDTAIQRNAGTYYDKKGLTLAHGLPLVIGDGDNRGGTWMHNVGQVQENASANHHQRFSTNIPAYIKTPTISWAAFNPGGSNGQMAEGQQQSGKSLDRWVALKRIEPDFLMSDRGDKISVTINTKEYAQESEISSQEYEFTGTTSKLDFNLQGRHMTFTFNFNGRSSVEMGQVMLGLGIGDKQ
jgi:hypothetical protein